jgi:hypothetical protein
VLYISREKAETKNRVIDRHILRLRLRKSMRNQDYD